jgi:hypothetical protein
MNQDNLSPFVGVIYAAIMKYTLDGQDIDDVDADQVAEIVYGYYNTEKSAKDHVKLLKKERRGEGDSHFYVKSCYINP